MGGIPLRGKVLVQGSKNAALPVAAASLLLGDGESLACMNVPSLKDTETLSALLEAVGMDVQFGGGSLVASRRGNLNCELPASLVQKMRASSILLGPLLAREGHAVMTLPGGCSIGTRPIDLHLKGLAKMGATIDLKNGMIYATAKKLQGCRICLDFPSVGATENLVMAAVLAEGETTIENAAREPEITNMVRALVKMGAAISYKNENAGVIKIVGGEPLGSAKVDVIPDRIAACTYLLAGIITDGEVTVVGVVPQHFDSLLAKLEEANVDYERSDDSVTVYPSRSKLKHVSVKTMPYPGFPTDVQPQLMAVMCLAEGTSIIKESIFESRFLHVAELRKMGASISVQGDSAVINGVPSLNGASVQGTDLRAGAALTLAALAVDGETRVHGLNHILRGYENFDAHLSSLGAKVSVEEDMEIQ